MASDGDANTRSSGSGSGSRFGHLPLSTSGPLDCALSGTALLNDPFFNKGSAFPLEERRAFGLHGLLPGSGAQTLETQARRARDEYAARPDDLAKNTYLTSMKEQNAVLYYKVSRLVPVSLPPLLSRRDCVCVKQGVLADG